MDDPRLIGTPEEAPAPVDEALLTRRRGVQVVSIAMIVLGLLLPTAVIVSTPGILTLEPTTSAVERVIGSLLLLALGGLLLIVGLVTNAIRALVVRGALPADRYRGPAIGVLLLLAVILAAVVSLGAGSTAAALLDGGELSVGGTLLLLTSTQFSLLAIVGLLVVVPRALVGVRLLPESGLARSLGIGLLAAVPAWIGATLLAYLWTALLEGIGLVQGVAIAEAVVERGDPTVVLVAFVVVAPIAEELFFRGVAYNAWIRERGPRFALYGSAALFALIHGSVFAFAPIFALGIALALVYRHTGSLPAAMAMHAGFNAISVVLTLLVRQGILNLPT